MPVQIVIDKSRCVSCGTCAKSCATGFLRMGPDGPYTNERAACIRCWHCAAACPKKAVLAEGEDTLCAHAEDPVEELIISRRSVRHFLPEPPEKELITWALDRACYAPSGKNRHANRWTVIYGLAHTRAVSDAALAVCRETGRSPELPMLAAKGVDLLTCHAPVLIIGWSPDNALNPCVDTVIAMHTAELLLRTRGVCACWGGYLRDMTSVSPALKSMLGIPDGCSMQCCMMVGYPKGESYPNIPARPKAEIIWA